MANHKKMIHCPHCNQEKVHFAKGLCRAGYYKEYRAVKKENESPEAPEKTGPAWSFDKFLAAIQ